MEKKYTLLAIFLLFVASPFAAFAHSHGGGGGCVPQDPPQGCVDLADYEKSFEISDFDKIILIQ